MDTISSRESSGSPLPLVGVIAGLLGLVLGVVALVKVSNANKRLDEHQPYIEKVDGIGAKADAASDAANKSKSDIARVTNQTNDSFAKVGEFIGTINGRLDKLEEAAKKAPVAAAKGSAGPVVAGPGEYVIKSGDTFTKIAKTLGVSAADLQAVNAGLNPSKLAVGTKIKVPKK